MLKGFLLICSLTATPNLADCTRDTAATYFKVPAEYANVVSCQMRVQAYFAGTPMASWSQVNPRLHFRAKISTWRTPPYQFKFTCVREEFADTELGETQERLKREILESNRKRLLEREVRFSGGG